MITKIDKNLELTEGAIENSFPEDILNEELITEEIQIGDAVRLDNQKGFVIGEIDGRLIIQVQGNTHLVSPKKVKENVSKEKLEVQPHMKFDEKTQKLLFEQLVRCGIYMGNVPVKITECYVKYSSWANATPDQPIKIFIEGNPQFMNKSQIRLFEDINTFANPDNYVPGVIIDEETETVLENILLNVVDYTEAVGDADSVRIIKGEGDDQEIQSMPKASLRTLAV